MEKIKKSYYDETLINNLATMLRMPREEVIDKLWANKVLTTKVQKASREAPSNNPQALDNRASFNARKPAFPERQAQAKADVATAAGPKYQNSLADLSGMMENHQNANGEKAPIPLDVLASKVNAKADDSLESSLVNKGISDVNPYIGTQYDITNVESLSRLLGMPESEVIGKLTKSLFRKGVNNEDDGSFMKRDGEKMPPEEEEGEEGEDMPPEEEGEDEGKSGLPLTRSLSLLDVFYASPSNSQKKN
jgi:hypothetical protein